MKVSTKGRYGLRALVDLATYSTENAIPLSSVAERQAMSLNYLEQVFGTLRKMGIVKSVKGAGGGYKLARNPKDITVKEVLEVLEGKFSITDLDEDSTRKDPVKQAIRELVWDRIDDTVNGFLSETTLDDLVKQYNKLEEDAGEMYYL